MLRMFRSMSPESVTRLLSDEMTDRLARSRSRRTRYWMHVHVLKVMRGPLSSVPVAIGETRYNWKYHTGAHAVAIARTCNMRTGSACPGARLSHLAAKTATKGN